MQLGSAGVVIMTAGAMLLGIRTAWSQVPADACALMSKDEFAAITGKTEYTDLTSMPWGSGTVCGFSNGQIVLFTGEDSKAAFDHLLASFGQEKLPREPVDGLGPDAFALFFDPESEYQGHGAFVVFGAGPPTMAVTIYAADGEQAKSALPQALAVARAIAAKLK